MRVRYAATASNVCTLLPCLGIWGREPVSPVDSLSFLIKDEMQRCIYRWWMGEMHALPMLPGWAKVCGDPARPLKPAAPPKDL
jgi:hypothetical protein